MCEGQSPVAKHVFGRMMCCQYDFELVGIYNSFLSLYSLQTYPVYSIQYTYICMYVENSPLLISLAGSTKKTICKIRTHVENGSGRTQFPIDFQESVCAHLILELDSGRDKTFGISIAIARTQFRKCF